MHRGASGVSPQRASGISHRCDRHASGRGEDDLNLYAYVRNDPLNSSDPAGTCTDNNCQIILDPTLANIGADFTPIVGDVKGGAEAIANPTVVTITAAVVGLIPIIGDAIARGLKTGSNIAENAAKGKAFENAVLESNGLTKNTETFTSSHGNTIPDSMTGGVNEVKASARVSDSAQLRAQREVAAEKGVPHKVFVQEGAKVSKTVERESTVIRCTKDGKPC